MSLSEWTTFSVVFLLGGIVGILVRMYFEERRKEKAAEAVKHVP